MVLVVRRDVEHERNRVATPKACGLYTRNSHNFTQRFPLVVAAVEALPAPSCLLDGEAVKRRQ